jgi:hypothetical protein
MISNNNKKKLTIKIIRKKEIKLAFKKNCF